MDTTIIYDNASTTEDEDATLTTPVNVTKADGSTSFSTSTSTPRNAGIPIPVLVGTLVGVIAFLTLLAVTVVMIIVSCVYVKRYKGKQNQGGEDHGYDYVTEIGRGSYRANNPIEMEVNEAYAGTHQPVNSQENVTDESQTIETHYEEIH